MPSVDKMKPLTQLVHFKIKVLEFKQRYIIILIVVAREFRAVTRGEETGLELVIIIRNIFVEMYITIGQIGM